MATTLGVLLGRYGGPQSFESVGSWAVSGQNSYAAQATDVHSSPAGGRIQVWSGGAAGAALTYGYAAADDAWLRWSPDVTTHRLVGTLWARIAAAANSGGAFAELAGIGSAALAYGAALARYRLETQATSADAIQFAFRRSASAGSYSIYVDDLLTAVDVLDLYPEWEAREARGQIAGGHRSALGRIRQTIWGTWPGWELPLRYVPSSAAAQLNRWWHGGWNLAFTLDSSDTAAALVARLVGPEPMQRMDPPYSDYWRGTLHLEGLSDGLDF